MVSLIVCFCMRLLTSPFVRSFDGSPACSFACLLVWSCFQLLGCLFAILFVLMVHLLVCLLAGLLVCLLTCLLACLLAHSLACLLVCLLAYFIARLMAGVFVCVTVCMLAKTGRQTNPNISQIKYLLLLPGGLKFRKWQVRLEPHTAQKPCT